MDNEQLLEQLVSIIEQSEKRIMGEITQINVKIENDVTSRINSLFDGYTLTHEKQWDLESKIQSLENRLLALESKAM